MKMSSHPSPLKSSTLGPQGQYVSTPSESDTSENFPSPLFANSSLPNIRRSFLSGIIPGATDDESALWDSAAHAPGGMLTHISGCMLVTKMSILPSPSKSKDFTPIEPHGVFGKYFDVASRKRLPPTLSQR